MAANGVSRFINTATYWQHYGNAAYDPVCLYAATKQALEDVLVYYVNCRGISATTLTLFDTYGPGDPRPKLLNALVEMCRKPEKYRDPLAMTAGEQLIDLVHIKDVARAYISAAELPLTSSPGNNRTFSISSGQPMQLRDVVRLLEKLAKCALPISWASKSYRQREVMTPWTRGEQLPGWNPSISLHDGLTSLVHGNQ
jgi:nucleoside-diphosphate-sugar epimerase